MKAVLIPIISIIFQVYYWMIIARILLSWVPQLADVEMLKPIVAFIFEVTDPFLNIFRRMIPKMALGGMGVDFSPFIAIITLILLERIVMQVLYTAL